MPRLVCDVYGCGERPLLAVHEDLTRAFYSRSELTCAGNNRCILEKHVRLCSVHAAYAGIVQLVLPLELPDDEPGTLDDDHESQTPGHTQRPVRARTRGTRDRQTSLLA